MMGLSVVVPVYNEAKFLKRCLTSLVGQDCEVIIVDDGSTDKSLAVCKRFEKYGFKIFEKENGGVSSARNYGIERATGDYIAFLDADDEWLPEASRIIRTNLKGQDLLSFNHLRERRGEIRPYWSYPSGKYSIKFRGHCWWGVWNKVFKREFLNKNQIRFDERCSFGEDELFVLDCLLINETYSHVAEKYLIRHFDNPHSIVHELKSNGVLEQYEGLKSRLSGKQGWRKTVIEGLMQEHRNSAIYKSRLKGLTPEQWIQKY